MLSRRLRASLVRAPLVLRSSYLAFLTPPELEPSKLAVLTDVPHVAVMPFGETALADLLTERVRRDLNATWGVCARGREDTLATLEANLRDSHFALTATLHGERLTAELWRAVSEGTELVSVIEHTSADFNELSVSLALRVCELLRRTPNADTPVRHGGARFPSVAWREAADARHHPDELAPRVAAGKVPPQAVHWLEDHPGFADLATRATLVDPWDAQLGFAAYCAHSASSPAEAARALVTSLRESPTHGKSQMCMAHLFPRDKALGERVLAHSRAGFRLLPNNTFAMTNLENYLRLHAPTDPQRASLLEVAIELDPLAVHPWMRAVHYFLETKRPQRALEAARELLALVEATPIHQRTLHSVTSHSGWDVETMRAHARKWLADCERAVAEATRN